MIPWVVLRATLLRMGYAVEAVEELQEQLHALDLGVPDPLISTKPAPPPHDHHPDRDA